MQKPLPFTKEFSVNDHEIDHFNHVNNLVYIKWVLEISKAHWNAVSPQSVRDQFGWMILKHEVQYKKQAKLNDKLLIKTWIEDYSTATSVRKTTITDSKTNKIIFESKAKWCFVNLDTRKPTRLTKDIVNPYFESL